MHVFFKWKESRAILRPHWAHASIQWLISFIPRAQSKHTKTHTKQILYKTGLYAISECDIPKHTLNAFVLRSFIMPTNQIFPPRPKQTIYDNDTRVKLSDCPKTYTHYDARPRRNKKHMRGTLGVVITSTHMYPIEPNECSIFLVKLLFLGEHKR